MASEAEEILELLEREKLSREQPVPQGLLAPSPVSQSPPGDDFIGAGTRQFVSNILGVPGAIGDVLDVGGAGLEAGLGGLGNLLGITDRADSFGGRFESAFDRRQQRGISALPRPTAEDFGAGLTAGVEGLDNLLQGARPDFAGEFRENLPLQQGVRERQLSTTAGQAGSLAGDVGTLLSGRVPFGGIQRAAKLAPEAARAATILGRAIQTTARSSTGVARRAAKIGAEAATLAALNGADPAEVGLIAAGAQASGDVLAKPIITGLRKLGLTRAILGASLVTIAAKEITPGGFQIVEETLKDRAKEVGLAAIIAGGGALATGRVSKDFAGPAFAEIAGAFKTAGLVRLIKGLKEDPERVGPVAEQFSIDPDFFGPEARKRLEKAFSGNANPATVISDLMNDKLFQRRFRMIGTPEALTFRQDQLKSDVRADNSGFLGLSIPKVAAAAVARLPKASELRSAFDTSGPQTFIAEIFRDEEGLSKLLPRMSEASRNNLLEANLFQIIKQSITRDPKPTIIGARLRQAWASLPDVARNAYSPEIRETIESFIEKAGTDELLTLPQNLAHSLMSPDGLLSQRLQKEK